MSKLLPLEPGMRVRHMESMFGGTVEAVFPFHAVVRWDYSGISYKRNRKNFHCDPARRAGVFVMGPAPRPPRES